MLLSFGIVCLTVIEVRVCDDFENISWFHNFAWIILVMSVGNPSPWLSCSTWETWLTIFGIYMITVLSMLLNFWEKYYYTETTPACYTCYIFLLYWYPVHWYFILPLYRYPDFHMLILLPWLPPSYPSDLSSVHIK